MLRKPIVGYLILQGARIHYKRTGKNIQHQVSGLLRQSVYARLAGYEDTNDHEGLSRDPAMRAVIGKRALERTAASSGTVSRFEEITRPGGDMERSVGWNAKNVGQPCMQGRIRIRVSALEAAYEGCWCIES